jgi:hypothetical protein
VGISGNISLAFTLLMSSFAINSSLFFSVDFTSKLFKCNGSLNGGL